MTSEDPAKAAAKMASFKADLDVKINSLDTLNFDVDDDLRKVVSMAPGHLFRVWSQSLDCAHRLMMKVRSTTDACIVVEVRSLLQSQKNLWNDVHVDVDGTVESLNELFLSGLADFADEDSIIIKIPVQSQGVRELSCFHLRRVHTERIMQRNTQHNTP